MTRYAVTCSTCAPSGPFHLAKSKAEAEEVKGRHLGGHPKHRTAIAKVTE